MSFGNLPVIKTLMSRTKRGHRVELTPDMISPPLGDFRHVMHVGRKGEVFGDTSFLSKHQEKRRQNRWNYLSQKLQQAGWINSARPSLRGRAGHPISPPPPISPIIKNAISLPLLANRSWDDEREDDKDIDVDMWKLDSTCGNQSAHCTLPRASSSEEPSEDTNSQKPEDDFGSAGFMENDDFSICTVPLELSCSLWRSDSMRSFVMDLGPSLMSEILEETGALHNDDLLQSFTQRSLSSNANEERILEFSQSLNDTQEPMTKQLITQEPMTKQLITQEPMTQRFITQEPMSQQFITQKPMSQQFITQEPKSQESITQEPMSQQFITQEQMSQQFITEEPMSQQFITQEPMSQQFITQEPLSQGHTIQELTAREPTNQRTVNQEQAAYGLMIRKPMTKGSNANEAEPMTNNPKNIRAPALVSWEPPPVVEEMEVDWKGNLRSFNTGLDSIGVLWVSEEEPALEM